MANEKKIVVKPDGPYIVSGNVPLVRKSQVISEHGEPLTWKKDDVLETKETYALCRCGQSGNKPFCDGRHVAAGFDGTENAPTDTTADRKVIFEGNGIEVQRDNSLCMHSGFCGNRFTNIPKMMPDTSDSVIRGQVISMVERCPSGSYTYSIEPGGDSIEPDLPEVIAVTTEGPYAGSLWVSGGIPVERADGEPFETRHRVTLCRCGLSENKPLCDGQHRTQAVTE
ncbi:MAG: CDGSH iron-sulfur domain-containing protein [Chloroflexota bacterium]